ncbi:MAG: hypothetical protein JWP81_1907 [Ferruginibacter sp.]|nr:hypothetical protein [Ferruginibacter sp.]
MNFKQRTLKLYSAITFITLATSCAISHKKPVAPARVMVIDPASRKADSAKRSLTLKPYAEIITKGTKSQTGFFTVHQKDNKYYFEIPNNILNREILVVNRVSKAASDMRNGNYGYAGDQIGETVYRFEKGPLNKLFLKRLSFGEYSKDSTSTMFASVEKNNTSTIVASFPVLALKKDSSAMVVDVTDFLNSDNDVLYFQKKLFKERAGMGGQQNDKSYIDYIHAFSTNVEIQAVKTYSAGLNPTNSSYTVELNSSLVLLPLKPMKPRLQDARVGYFTTSFRDFDADPQGVEKTTYIKRWNLEPKPEDVEKYKRGELVEPKKQIVFYIDPVTPKKWVPYLMQGINDWQKAFEAAGFKNAIIAKEAPTKEQDSTWSIDDASHSAIIYRPSIIANAMGPSISDPRSGEIMESHIFWYHNVMSLLQKWYMMQAGAVDPKARKTEFDEELMGNLIRFVSSHEVGHTLGLLHNFGSSSTVPVEKLRDKAWVEAHGHTPSIMDYARFNYVAQPEDNISEAGLFPRIGEYDRWAIKWAYTWHPEFKTPEQEQKELVKVVTDSLTKNHRLWFGSEVEPLDPRSQNEDLSDNAVKAGGYGIKNLKRILPQLEQWVEAPNENQEKLLEYYTALWGQFQLYMGHAIKNVGGSYHSVEVNAQSGPIYTIVPFQIQKDAVQFINNQLFDTPMWLYNTSIFNKLALNFGIEINELQKAALEGLISRNRLSQLLTQEQTGKGKVYAIDNLFSDMDNGIYKEVYKKQNIDFYRRNLQKIYLYRIMEEAFFSGDMTLSTMGRNYHFSVTDMNAILRAELRKQQALFRSALKNPGLDKLTKLHLKDMDDTIERKFAAEKTGLAANK